MIDYLQNLIDSEIPIAQKMGITVSAYIANELRLLVPIEGNKNHKDTAFGGSIYSALALSGWGLLAGNIEEKGIRGEVVLQDATIKYKKPLVTDFETVCSVTDQDELDRFLEKLDKKGKAKITVVSTITDQGELAARFTGTYVAVA